MLTYFREHISRLAVTIILVLVAVSLAMIGLQSQFRGGARSDVVASVGGEAITVKDWSQSYLRLLMLMPKADRDRLVHDPKEQALWRKRAFEHVQVTRATESGLRELDYHLNPIVLDRALRDLEAFQQDGRFSLQRFREYLKEMNMSEHVFLEGLRLDVLLSQLHDAMALSSFALPDEVVKWYDLMAQKRSVHYVLINQSVLKQTNHDTKAIEAYYKEHQANWTLPDKVRLEYVLLNPKQLTVAAPSPKALKMFYREHIQWFTQPAAFQCEVLEIASEGKGQRLSDSDIERLLKHYHGDAAQQEALATLLNSNARHWRIHYPSLEHKQHRWYARASLPQAVVERLQRTALGESTEPFDIQGRHYLYRLVAKRSDQAQPFTAVSSKVERLLRDQMQQEHWSEQVEQLRESVYAYPSELTTVAKQLGLKVKQTEWLKRGDQDHWHNAFADPNAFDQVIFDEDWIADAKNSEPLRLSDGRLLVVRPLAYQKASTPPLQQIRSQVEKAYLAAYAKKQMLKQAEELQSLWQKKPNETSSFGVEKNTVVHWSKPGPFSASALAAIYQMDFGDHRVAIIPYRSTGYWVVRLDKVEAGEMMSDRDRSQYKKRLHLSMVDGDFHLFRSVLLRDKDFHVESEALLDKILSPSSASPLPLSGS